MATVSGKVYDDAGLLANGRKVRLYRRDSGILLTSGTTGSTPLAETYAMYPFDSDGADTSGNNLNATLENVTFGTGQLGQAAVFNGSNARASLPVGDAQIWNSVSFAFWAYRVQDNESSSVFLKKDDDNASTNGGRVNAHFPWSTGTLYWDFGNPYVRAETAWQSGWYNTWAHWVFIADNISGRMEVWRNNTIVASSDASSMVGVTFNNDMWLAYYENGNSFVNVQIDDFRIYKRALSTTEIADLYNKTNPQPAGDGEYTLVTDYTGETYVVCLDDDAGVQYNAKILDRIVPA